LFYDDSTASEEHATSEWVRYRYVRDHLYKEIQLITPFAFWPVPAGIAQRFFARQAREAENSKTGRGFAFKQQVAA
jgi:hypothetical protein